MNAINYLIFLKKKYQVEKSDKKLKKLERKLAVEMQHNTDMSKELLSWIRDKENS